MNKKALVVFSGGQDSTTCLLWALRKFEQVSIISFDYGQRHIVELEQAIKIIEKISTDLDVGFEHVIIPFNLNTLLNTAMTSQSKIEINKETALPSTFVPGRNLLFLTLACAYAYQHNIHHIVTGVCQTDYSGYPDCRDATIKSLQATIRLGMDKDLIIHTPLMWMDKANTVLLMKDLGGLKYYKFTHTCYNGKRPACGKCPACMLRIRGFREAGIEDPLDYEYEPTKDEIAETIYQLEYKQYKAKKEKLIKKYDYEFK